MNELFTEDFYKFLLGFMLILAAGLMLVAGAQVQKKDDPRGPSITPISTTTQAGANQNELR